MQVNASVYFYDYEGHSVAVLWKAGADFGPGYFCDVTVLTAETIGA